jgi:hypothetical protein
MNKVGISAQGGKLNRRHFYELWLCVSERYLQDPVTDEACHGQGIVLVSQHERTLKTRIAGGYERASTK